MKLLKLLTVVFLFFTLAPLNVFAASANFSTTGGGNVNTGQSISVIISVNGSAAYNAVSVNVAYSNLTFISASANSSWTPVSGPGNSGGTVSFSGAVLGSSFTGTKTVMTINFKANTNGTATIHPSGSIALADGNGTQVSGGGNTATYSVTPPPTPTPAPKPAAGAVSISSSSHPDSTKWYKATDVVLTWNKDSGVTDFSYIIDQAATTNPDDTSEGGDSTKTFTNVPQGTNYFHIKAKNDVGWGPASHFQINIDNSTPNPFTVTKTDDGKNYYLYFSTDDSVSGIAKYTVKVDGVDKGEQKTEYKLDKTAINTEVTAFDKADNSFTSKINLKNSETVTTNTNQQNPITTTIVQDSAFGKVGFILIIVSGVLLLYGGVLSYLYWRKIH